jgi:DnaK suppressor protein
VVTAKKTSKKAVKKTATRTSAKNATKVTKKTTARKKSSARKISESEILANKPSGSKELIHGIAPYIAKSRESYMNEKQQAHFYSILTAWRHELVNEVNRTIHSMQDETVNHPDPNDRATQESDMSLELRSRDRERKLIKKIDGTIALIESGDYGYCEKCGVEVGIARLEARPTATLCVDCKTLDEIREKQMI